MTDDQLADSTYSEAVAASLLGVQILRSFPGVGDFEGTVVGTSAPAEASDPFLHEVRWSDGDEEELTMGEVLRGQERFLATNRPGPGEISSHESSYGAADGGGTGCPRPTPPNAAGRCLGGPSSLTAPVKPCQLPPAYHP